MSTPSPPSTRSHRSLPGPTSASMPTPSTPADVLQNSPSGPSYASVVRLGHDTVPQQESGSESDLELDSVAISSASPPHFTIPEDEEFDTTPESPSASPPSPPPSPPTSNDIGPAVLPQYRLPTFCSGSEDYQSSDDEEDPCFKFEEDPYFKFKYLVDNFISAVENVWNCKSILPEDTMYKEAGNQHQSDKFAVSALEHYNKVKYELISAITSCGIMARKGCYGHVNFTAKGNQKNSKEELFFAELRFDYNTLVTTCVLSLNGAKAIGGLRGSKYDNGHMGLRIDAQHCYACGRGVKHPKNGTLYEAGHVADSDHYCV